MTIVHCTFSNVSAREELPAQSRSPREETSTSFLLPVFTGKIFRASGSVFRQSPSVSWRPDHTRGYDIYRPQSDVLHALHRHRLSPLTCLLFYPAFTIHPGHRHTLPSHVTPPSPVLVTSPPRPLPSSSPHCVYSRTLLYCPYIWPLTHLVDGDKVIIQPANPRSPFVVLTPATLAASHRRPYKSCPPCITPILTTSPRRSNTVYPSPQLCASWSLLLLHTPPPSPVSPSSCLLANPLSLVPRRLFSLVPLATFPRGL